MPGMMDTVLNLGLNDESVAGPGRRARATRASPGTPTGASCRCSATSSAASRASASRTRSRAIKGERGVRARHRARRRRAARADPPLPGALRLPDRPARAARARDPRRVRLLDGRPRRRLPAHQRHPRRLGHRGQRPADGLRQPRAERSGSGVAFSRDEVTGAPEPSGDFLRRRAGRGRRLRRAHAARPRRAARLDARGPRAAARDPAHARAPLRGHAGHRVHDRGGAPVHAADAQRQAPRAGRGALRRRRRRGGAAHAAPRRSRTIDAGALDALLHPTFDPAARYEVVARGVAASPGAAKGAIVFTAEDAVAAAAGGRGGHPRAARSPRPTTSPASTPRRASSPPRAARPRTPRSWRAAWAARP